jgi:hypothetical protein
LRWLGDTQLDLRDLNVKTWIITINDREKWASVVKEVKVRG